MSKKDKGWDYLNSDDVNETFNEGNPGDYGYRNADGSGSYYGGDGSWGYQNSDGSGSYYGQDGSWGYKNSDGSGSYYGQDGSWGYKNSDGSGSYYGEDGSWGYQNSDGSGAYYDKNNPENNEFYDAEDEDMDETDQDDSAPDNIIDGVANILGNTFTVLTSLAMEKAEEEIKRQKEAEAEEELKRQVEDKIRKEKRAAWRKQHRKGIGIFILSVFVVIIIAAAVFELTHMITTDYSSDDLIGQNYEQVEEKLKDAGFLFVKCKAVDDLSVNEIAQDNNVTDIKIFGKIPFKADSKTPYNLPITITYHTLQTMNAPLSSKEAKGENYEEVIKAFKEAGFINVSTKVEYDVIFGWIAKDGEVKSVTIDGDKKFTSNDGYRLDAEVVVTYHTLAKNKK